MLNRSRPPLLSGADCILRPVSFSSSAVDWENITAGKGRLFQFFFFCLISFSLGDTLIRNHHSTARGKRFVGSLQHALLSNLWFTIWRAGRSLESLSPHAPPLNMGYLMGPYSYNGMAAALVCWCFHFLFSLFLWLFEARNWCFLPPSIFKGAGQITFLRGGVFKYGHLCERGKKT